MTVYAKVKTMRDAGLEAKWGRLRTGAPALFVRNPASENSHQKNNWWLFDRDMQKSMTKKGVVAGFNASTAFGDIFSLPV